MKKSSDIHEKSDFKSGEALCVHTTFYTNINLGPNYRISDYGLYNGYTVLGLNRRVLQDYPGIDNSMANIISKLFEGGIPNKIFNFYQYQKKLNHLKKMEFESHEPKPLQFNHIKQMALICLFGWALSFASFSWELKCLFF